MKTQVGAADFELLRRLVNTLIAIMAIMTSSRAMLSRLRRLFGLQSSERSRDILEESGAEDAADASGESAADTVDPEPEAAEGRSRPAASGRPSRKGHGRLPSSVYEAATHIAVPHQKLQGGGSLEFTRFGGQLLGGLRRDCLTSHQLEIDERAAGSKNATSVPKLVDAQSAA